MWKANPPPCQLPHAIHPSRLFEPSQSFHSHLSARVLMNRQPAAGCNDVADEVSFSLLLFLAKLPSQALHFISSLACRAGCLDAEGRGHDISLFVYLFISFY